MRVGRARIDPLRGARVVARRPLLYARGADARLDRPPHVRAGSALTAHDGQLAVVQDDACFLAIVDRDGPVRDVPFPISDGVRLFDDDRGNKKKKLDLEAAFVARDGALLVALGSGSSPLRERVVLVAHPFGETPRVTIVEAKDLYDVLRSAPAFCGSELNVEGAAVHGDDVVFFQRGNGAPRSTPQGEIAPVDATARMSLTALLEHLEGAGPPPSLREIIQWDLGRAPMDVGPTGRRLTFTDGAVTPSGVLAFLACAEDSPDATRDGPVSAVAIGTLDEAARTAELGLVLDESGAPLLDKAEGLAFDAADGARAFVVTDRDDPDAPSELLELRLGDAWS
jgi:hypothetical protein